MTDTVEKIGNSIIQHGRNNQRIYLMKSSTEDLPGLIYQLDELAERDNYSKVFAKVPASQRSIFVQNAYQVEASVPSLFNGTEEGLFLAKYPIGERGVEKKEALVNDILEKAKAKQGLVSGICLAECTCRPLFSEDMDQAAGLYRFTFASYPFPIHDPEYLRSTMDHIAYYGVWSEGQLVALSSAEIDFENSNAEMTDFATHPDFQGKGLASFLLARMETDMKDRQIATLYTIARAYSYGMNITFAKNGYLYCGTLTNNTQISGNLESMNVWYKLLPSAFDRL
jgi:putative beta-lysine N-acetyltransferase